jgi:recombination associated protein RdgC
MELVDLLHEKSFLGQEFLTWLWWQSEEGTEFTLAGGRVVALALGERMSLAPPWGHDGAHFSLAGRDHLLAEARQGLRVGKLVDSLRLAFIIDGDEYWFSLQGAWLAPLGLRLPASADSEEGGLDSDGLTLERIGLLENLSSALDGVFALFLEQRLAHPGHWPELEAWIKHAPGSSA